MAFIECLNEHSLINQSFSQLYCRAEIILYVNTTRTSINKQTQGVRGELQVIEDSCRNLKTCKYVSEFASLIRHYNQKSADSSRVPGGPRNPTVLLLLRVLVTLTERKPQKGQAWERSRVLEGSRRGEKKWKKKRASGTCCLFTDRAGTEGEKGAAESHIQSKF